MLKNNQYIWQPYCQMKNAQLPLPVKTALGSKIILEDNRELIDGIASWWSVAHGYQHPKLIEAIKNQADKLTHVMFAGLANEPAYKLAAKLAGMMPSGTDKVFFSDSGSTAIEVAIKIAVQFFLNQGIKNKSKIVSFVNGYHGDTTGGMSLSDLKNGMHAKFSNILPSNILSKIPQSNEELDEFATMLKKNKAKIAAVIIEPLVQCAGGMKFHSKETLYNIYQITKDNDLLFIVDECAVGFYRTGSLFAFNHAKIKPDIICLGKALTGGMMTLAATICSTDIFNKFLGDSLDLALAHGPTFMGNALACAVANSSLDLFLSGNYKKLVKDIENIFKTELQKFKNLSNISDVRIIGAIGVIEFKESDFDYILFLRKKFIEFNVWLRPFANVLYFMPPLVIAADDLIKIINISYEIIAGNKSSK